MKEYFIMDGHLDLAMNAMEWSRDLTKQVSEIREQEKDIENILHGNWLRFLRRIWR